MESAIYNRPDIDTFLLAVYVDLADSGKADSDNYG
jgi:hypothetical protein